MKNLIYDWEDNYPTFTICFQDDVLHWYQDENISDLLFFADRHKNAPHYWTLRTPYFASWEASLSCRVPVFPNRLGPLAPSKGFGSAT